MTIELTSEIKVTLIDSNADDERVARAAWVSNYREPERKDTSGIDKLIKYLYKNRHMSPFEHGSFTFLVECPIFVTREWHRHRTQSYNEMSARYQELIPKFYIPPRERKLVRVGKPGHYKLEAGSDDQYGNTISTTTVAYQFAWTAYQDMLGDGIAPEVARNVLPVGIYTKFYATANPRNIMQFLELRDDDPALFEIREAAKQIDTYLQRRMPLTYAAYKENRNG